VERVVLVVLEEEGLVFGIYRSIVLLQEFESQLVETSWSFSLSLSAFTDLYLKGRKLKLSQSLTREYTEHSKTRECLGFGWL
jgi:hypothetical protein